MLHNITFKLVCLIETKTELLDVQRCFVNSFEHRKIETSFGKKIRFFFQFRLRKNYV